MEQQIPVDFPNVEFKSGSPTELANTRAFNQTFQVDLVAPDDKTVAVLRDILVDTPSTIFTDFPVSFGAPLAFHY